MFGPLLLWVALQMFLVAQVAKIRQKKFKIK
jgi:hypothetical protein